MCVCKHVAACVRVCVRTCTQLSLLVKQSVSVLTAMSHTADQSQGTRLSELLINPPCVIPIYFNLGSHDLGMDDLLCGGEIVL